MNIAIALNREAIPQTVVLLCSIAENLKNTPVQIFVLHSELTEPDKNILNNVIEKDKNISIQYIYIDPNRVPDLPKTTYWSIETYYRLMLGQLLDETVERILYLDVDMIVNRDISEFYEMDFEDKLMVVSKDMEFENMLHNTVDSTEERNEFFGSLQKDGMTYFCAGMLLMNIRGIRDAGYTFKRYMDIFSSICDKIVFLDQDLLNYVHYKDVKFVDEKKYGLLTQSAHALEMTYQDVKDNTYLIHFSGKAKPWTVNLIRYDIEKIWWEYARKCPYYYELMEQVFYRTMESTFTEEKIKELMSQNRELREIALHYQAIIKHIMGENNE